ncbi:MAG: hypothetical protein PF447_11070, partial [Spirochaetaceae bacterium]|nr:hypothetical protein [Spirochaetaceae bacterium]
NGEIIDGDAWQEAFRREMEKGLLLWDEAERELLVERSQWERDASILWDQGEEQWAQAFQELSVAREEWISELGVIKGEGLGRFVEEDDKLQSLIDKATLERGQSIAQRKDSLQNRMDTYIDLLTDSIGMAQSCRESWEYWAINCGLYMVDELNVQGEVLVGDIPWDSWAMTQAMVSEIIDGHYEWGADNLRNIEEETLTVYEELTTFFFTGLPNKEIPVEVVITNYAQGNREFLNYILTTKIPEEYNINDRDSANFTEPLDAYQDFFQTKMSNDEEISSLIQQYIENEVTQMNDAELKDYFSERPGNPWEILESHIFLDYENDSLEKRLQDGSIFNMESIYNEESMAQALEILRGELFDEDNTSAVLEGLFWAQKMEFYSNEALTYRDKLAESYGIVVNGDGSVDHYQPGNDSNLELTSSLNNWDEFILDDGQIALLKAESVLAFWQREQSIAEAVLEYAQDNSSNRENEDVTSIASGQSLEAYNDGVNKYNSLVAYMDEFVSDFNNKQSEITTIQQSLANLRTELDNERKKIAQILMSYQVSADEVKKQIYDEYQRLISLYQVDNDNNVTTPLKDARVEYMAALYEYDMEDVLVKQADLFNEISSSEGTVNLAWLRESEERLSYEVSNDGLEIYEKTYFWGDENSLDLLVIHYEDELTYYDSCEDFNGPSSDQGLSILSSIQFDSEYKINSINENNQLSEQDKENLISQVVNGSMISAVESMKLYEQVIQRMRIEKEKTLSLLAGNLSNWNGENFYDVLQMEQVVQAAAEGLDFSTLELRVSMDKDLLEKFQESISGQNSWPNDFWQNFNAVEEGALLFYLNDYCNDLGLLDLSSLTAEDTAAIQQRLTGNIADLGNLGTILANNQSLEDKTASLESLIVNNRLAVDYLRGIGLFNSSQGDLMALLSSEDEHRIRIEVQQQVMTTYRAYNLSLLQQYRQEQYQGLIDGLVDLDVIDGSENYDLSTASLRDPGDIFQRSVLEKADPDEIAETAIEFIRDLKELEGDYISGLSKPVQQSFMEWSEELIRFFGVSLVKNGISVEGIEGMYSEDESQQDPLITFQDSYQNAASDLERALLFLDFNSENQGDYTEEYSYLQGILVAELIEIALGTSYSQDFNDGTLVFSEIYNDLKNSLKNEELLTQLGINQNTLEAKWKKGISQIRVQKGLQQGATTFEVEMEHQQSLRDFPLDAPIDLSESLITSIDGWGKDKVEFLVWIIYKLNSLPDDSTTIDDDILDEWDSDAERPEINWYGDLKEQLNNDSTVEFWLSKIDGELFDMRTNVVNYLDTMEYPSLTGIESIQLKMQDPEEDTHILRELTLRAFFYQVSQFAGVVSGPELNQIMGDLVEGNVDHLGDSEEQWLTSIYDVGDSYTQNYYLKTQLANGFSLEELGIPQPELSNDVKRFFYHYSYTPLIDGTPEEYAGEIYPNSEVSQREFEKGLLCGSWSDAWFFQ